MWSKVHKAFLVCGAIAPLAFAGAAAAQSPISASAPPPAPISYIDRPQPSADMQAVLDAVRGLGAKQYAVQQLKPALAQ